MNELQDLLDEHNIRYFRAGELYSRTPESRDKTVIPPEELWPNIILTLQCADEIREMMGCPVWVISGYRSPEYNAAVGGSKTSEHMMFRALDLKVPGQYERLKAVAASVMDHAYAAGYATGFGTYDDAEFVHVDTGATKAKLRRWKG